LRGKFFATDEPAAGGDGGVRGGVGGERIRRSASEVLCECHWQAKEVRAERLTAILVHGLEGSSDSQYVVGNANKLWRAGANVVRMNMRNCGGSGYEMARRTPTLYHSGLSGDVDRVMRHFIAREGLERVGLVGYSMGGNLVMKLVGRAGRGCAEGAAGGGGGVAGDRSGCERNGSAQGGEPAIRAAICAPRCWSGSGRRRCCFRRCMTRGARRGVGSVREFDERITAFYSGFASAADYYFRAAAARVVDKIALPALIVQALDDPFVHITPETRAAIKGNRCITLLETEHGGHCAFLAKADGASGDDGYWAETTLVRFLLAQG
jgi:predicted alpha/beta-fold hydrolase